MGFRYQKQKFISGRAIVLMENGARYQEIYFRAGYAKNEIALDLMLLPFNLFPSPISGKHPQYLGKRIKRGIFHAIDSRLINADMNCSANIISKSIPKSLCRWDTLAIALQTCPNL